MQSIKTKISSIEKKIDVLMQDYMEVARHNYNLEKEQKRLQDKVDWQQNHISKLEKTLSILKKQKGMGLTHNEREDLNGMLDEYILEIDKCIASLSR